MYGPDLYFIKTHNTGSGMIEVHSATAASGYQSGIDLVTRYSEADANNGWFQIGNKDSVISNIPSGCAVVPEDGNVRRDLTAGSLWDPRMSSVCPE